MSAVRTRAPALFAVLAVSVAGAEQAPIDEVLVTATRRSVSIADVASALTLIDASTIGQGKLVTDAFSNQPGGYVQQTTPGQGAAIVRGLKGSAILHLVDGMRLNNAIFRSAPTQYFALVPVTAAGRIELVRGTPASLYGSDAVGGVVQLVTYKPAFDGGDTRYRGDVSAGFDSAELGKAVRAKLDAGNRALVTSVSAAYLDTSNRRVGGGERVGPSGYRSTAARWYVAGNPDERRTWSIDAHWLEQPRTPRIDELVPGFGQAEPSSSEYSFEPNRRVFVHGDYTRRGGWLRLDWDLDLAWQRVDDDRVTRDFGASERRYEENRSDLYGFTASGSRVGEAGSWIVGAEYYLDRVTSSRREENLVDGQVSVLVPRFPDGSEVRQAAFYANAERHVGERYVLSGGLRFSREEVTLPQTPVSDAASVDVSDFAGDLGWIVNLGEAWQFAVNAGFGFRAPNVFDMGTLGERPGNRFNVPNTDLDSEHVVQLDAGVRYRGDSAELQLTAYTMRYDDRITSVPTGDVTPPGREVVQSVNAARSTIRGIEFGADVDLSERLHADAVVNYTWGEERVEGSPTEPADRIPPLGGRLTLHYDAGPNLALSGWIAFADRQGRLSARDAGDPRIDPNGTTGWVTIGARGTLDHGDGWLFTLGLDNVLDKRYRDHGSGIDAPGRNLYVVIRRTW